jgi:molybdenum cofactor biosynthesis enzyme MoaA
VVLILGFETVLKTIDRALELGITPLKLNCVIIKNLNDAEVLDFVELTREKPIEVRFIEFMPFDGTPRHVHPLSPGNKWDFAKIVSAKTLLQRIRDVHPNIEPLPALPGETSKTYHLPGTHVGRVGFISSMTDHFCGTCNRLRITADGNLKVCLFGEDEVSLRDLMRGGATDEELLQVIGKAVGEKKEAHGGMTVEELKYGNNRSMIRIGG